MINLFISATGNITREQRNRLDSFIHERGYEGLVVVRAGCTKHDLQELWADIDMTQLNRIRLFFDSESMLPFQIFRCLEALYKLNAGNQKIIKDINTMIRESMYRIDAQGYLYILELDPVNDALFSAYITRPAGMLCESLI